MADLFDYLVSAALFRSPTRTVRKPQAVVAVATIEASHTRMSFAVGGGPNVPTADVPSGFSSAIIKVVPGKICDIVDVLEARERSRTD